MDQMNQITERHLSMNCMLWFYTSKAVQENMRAAQKIGTAQKLISK